MKIKQQLTTMWIAFALSAVIWMGMSVTALAADGILSLTCNQNEITAMESLEVRIDAGATFNSADVVLMYDSDSLIFDRENTDLRDIALVQEVETGKIRLIDYGEERTGYTLKFRVKDAITEETSAAIRVEAASFGNAATAVTGDVSAIACENAVLNVNVKPKGYQITFEKIEGFTGTFPEDTMLSGKEDYTFNVPVIANYTVTPVVSINGGAGKKPEVENQQVTIPKEAVTGNIKVQFELTKKNECAGTADNGYKTDHQFLAEPVYTWNGFASCSAVRTCDCGVSVKRGYAVAAAELVESGQRRQYTAVFKAPFTTQYKYGNSITVTFRLIGDHLHAHANAETAETLHTEYVTWIPETEYRIYEGMTVGDVFKQALEDSGMEAMAPKGGDWAESGYVAGIRAPEVLDSYWLQQKDNGALSGWLYSVNGIRPSAPLTECELNANDQIVWFYADNYAREDSEKPWLKAEDCTPETYLWKSSSVERNGEGRYILDMAAAPQNGQILVAVYGRNGKMIDIRLVNEQDMTKNAAGRMQADIGTVEEQITVFFTDKMTFAPKRESMTTGTQR